MATTDKLQFHQHKTHQRRSRKHTRRQKHSNSNKLSNSRDSVRAVKAIKVTTLYLNKREEGFCDNCCREVEPADLIRSVSKTTKPNGDILRIIGYICENCNE